MRLTAFTDYSLRLLVFLARNPDRFVTIREIAAAEGVSANHLMKVAQHLAGTGFILTLRGPRGGLRLGRPANAIQVGDVVRGTEPDITAVCGGVFGQAMAAFVAVLDRHTVADLAGPTD